MAILYAVLDCNTMPVSRMTSVVTIGMTGNFKVYIKDLRTKLYVATLSIKNSIYSPLILSYKYITLT